MERLVWIDGRLVPWQSASIHLLSHAAQRGSLVFDAMSLYETKRGAAIFRLHEHLDRLRTSCELVGLPLCMSDSDLLVGISAALRANPGATSIKVCAYFASIEVDVAPVDTRVSVAIAAYDSKLDIVARLPAIPTVAQRALRIKLDVGDSRADCAPGQAKVAASYVAPMIAKVKARKEGYDEVLMVGRNGELLECSSSNVFLVDGGGSLCTPPAESVLLGVTRSTIIDLARSENLKVSEAHVPGESIFQAREVFLTATSAGLRAVESVNGRKIGSGRVGPIATRLNECLFRVRRGEDSRFLHWLTWVDDLTADTCEVTMSGAGVA